MIYSVLIRWLSAGLYYFPVKELRKLNLARSQSTHIYGKKRQLLIDVSNIIVNDHGTGIQRVVRSVISQLSNINCEQFEIKPVYATRKYTYRYADLRFLDTEDRSFLDKNDFVKVQRGDVFLGLDLNANRMPSYLLQILFWKLRGVGINIVVYDLLPLLHPEWFPDTTAKNFKRWIKVIAMISDRAFCISSTVQKDLLNWMSTEYNINADKFPSYVIPLGWDIEKSKPSKGFSADFKSLCSIIIKYKSAIIVGTIEPRKGHDVVINAFEELWQKGEKYNLIIVGRVGWKTDNLQEKLRSHKMLNKHLFWFENATDEMLDTLYQLSFGVIAPSYGEGFGLPLIEALYYNKPILVRDTPIFREVAKGDVTFFSEDDSNLMQSLIDWFNATDSQKKHTDSNISDSWRKTALTILDNIQNKTYA